MPRSIQNTAVAGWWIGIQVMFAATFASASDKPDGADGRHDTLLPAARVLVTRCFECHGGGAAEGGYDMSTLGGLRSAGDSGQTAVVPGEPKASELVRRLTTSNQERLMPLGGPRLADDEISAVRRWIETGAGFESWGPETDPSELPFDGDETVTSPNGYPRPLPIAAAAVAGAEDSGAAAWIEDQWLAQLVRQVADATPRDPTPLKGLVITSGYGELLLWDIRDGTLRRRVGGFGRDIRAIAIDPARSGLAVAHGTSGSRGRVTLVSLSGSGSATRSDALLLGDVPESLAFSPTGDRLAVGGLDGSLHVIDVGSASPTRQTVPHADAVLDVTWSKDGARLITASRDRTVRVVEVASERAIANFAAHERSVHSVGVIAAGVVTMDETRRLRLWPAGGGRPMLSRQFRSGSDVPIAICGDVIVVPDGDRLRRLTVRWETVEDGKDKDGKKKTKRVPRWNKLPPLALEADEIPASLTADDDETLAVGTHAGQVVVWSEPATESPRQPPLRFNAWPRFP